MPITYSRLSNGDTFDAASLNDRFSSVESSLNALTKSDVRESAFGRDHLPSLATSTPQTTTVQVTGGSPYHTYTRANAAYPGWGASSGSWTIIDSSGGGGGGTDLEVTLTSTPTSGVITDEKYGGVLVLMNVQVRSLMDVGTSSTLSQEMFFAIVAIQVYAGSTWYHINRTERYLQGNTIQGISGDPSNQKNLWYDIPVRTVIKATDVSNNSITKVRGVVGIAKVTGSTATVADHQLRLNRCTITAIPLHGKLT